MRNKKNQSGSFRPIGSGFGCNDDFPSVGDREPSTWRDWVNAIFIIIAITTIGYLIAHLA